MAGGATKPRWAWLFWVQLAIVLLAMLGAYLGLLDLSALAVPGMDKTLHFVLYGALAFFSVGWWADRRPRTILGIMSVLAILEEASQSLSAARTFSVIDLTAALLGIFVLGFAAHRLVHGRRRALKRRRSA